MSESVPMPRDARFRRSDRLRLPQQFQQCFAQGQRVNGRCFRLHLLPAPQPRLGLAVSRKVDPDAVGRNRIKRVVRESFRHARASLPPMDCVIVARPEAARADNAALRAELSSLWRRAGALKRPPPAGTMRDASAAPDASRAV